MTIQELGSLGEFIAAIATVATLLYLAVQIRGNTKALHSEARARSHDQTQSYGTVIGGNRQAAEVFTRGVTDFDSLDPVDRTQFHFLFAMLISQADVSHHNYQLGLGDREWMEGVSRSVSRLLQTPGGREYWRLNGSGASPPFRKFVEEHLVEAENRSPVV